MSVLQIAWSLAIITTLTAIAMHMWLAVHAFRRSFLWGISSLLVPLVGVFFAFARLNSGRKLLLGVTYLGVCVLSVLLLITSSTLAAKGYFDQDTKQTSNKGNETSAQTKQ